ncbi:hypercellular protein HypA [Fusarium austroafricanum]|uniref:Geranylgeranyl transferase type-2 subunit alpha n=1 Tax=Fusarium austroafricanum TaxID=2364996 RepID=A0A8H4NT10_9HYPO|nr:hypercellular protein HypA [Fusarium austroafricanum]
MPPTRGGLVPRSNFNCYPNTNRLRHGKFGDVLIHRLSQRGVSRTSRVRTEEQRLRDIEKIKEYRHLENQIFTHAASGDYDPALFQLTTKLLRLNPEHYTTWNVRRRCLISSLFTKPPSQQRSNVQGKASDDGAHEPDIAVLKSELSFTIPLLMSFPKSYWIWNFRQWILSQAILRLGVAAAREMWHTELGLTSLMLDKDQRNFHAWGYRRILVDRLQSPELGGKSMAEDEFAYTTKIIRRNLSNFSAWYHRSRVISRLLQERAAERQERAAFLDQELDLVRRALDVGPEDQTYVRHEIDKIKDLLDDYNDVKWIYQALLEYTLILERLGQRARDEDGLGGLKQAWLTKLRTLDPMRAGRWNDIEKQIQLGEARK